MSNQWNWRDGEVSLKTYYLFTPEEKEEHIKLLKTIPTDKLSNNDIAILNVSAPEFLKPKNKNFLSLDEMED